ALHVYRDFAGEVATGDSRGDFGDVADLAGQVAGPRVDRGRETFPGTGDAGHVGLTAKAAFGADFAGDASDFGGEGTQLLDHCVQRFFELQNFATDVDRDFAGEVAAGDGGGDFGDVSYL